LRVARQFREDDDATFWICAQPLGREALLPGEILPGVRPLAFNGSRKLDTGDIVFSVTAPHRLYPMDMITQFFPYLCRKHQGAVLVASPAFDRQNVAIESKEIRAKGKHFVARIVKAPDSPSNSAGRIGIGPQK
jgi:hypothetical protein